MTSYGVMKGLFRKRIVAPNLKPAEMRYVSLGRSGLKVSRICLGTMSFGTEEWQKWTIPEDRSRDILRRAIELGINFIDTADVYSHGASEEVVGRHLYDFVPRHKVIIATKVNGPMGPAPNDRGLSRKHVLSAVDSSLSRLRTDYIDLYLIHRWDYETPIEETLGALHDVVRAGKVLYLGASSMFAWEFLRALHASDKNKWPRFVAMQNHYNLIYREEEREMLPLCRHEGIAVLPWSPLARGLLTGRARKRNTLRSRTDEYSRRLYYQECDFTVADRVDQVAKARGVQPAQVALAWLLSRPGVTSPVLGVTDITHLDEAAGASGLVLRQDEIQRLEECYQPHPVLGHP